MLCWSFPSEGRVIFLEILFWADAISLRQAIPVYSMGFCIELPLASSLCNWSKKQSWKGHKNQSTPRERGYWNILRGSLDESWRPKVQLCYLTWLNTYAICQLPSSSSKASVLLSSRLPKETPTCKSKTEEESVGWSHWERSSSCERKQKKKSL